MKNSTLKWLLEIADRKPLLFSIALLLIAISTLSLIVRDRDRRLEECNYEQQFISGKYEKKYDSLEVYYRKRELDLNNEMKETLNGIIADYRNQVNQQKKLNNEVTSTLNRTKSLIKLKSKK